MLKKLLKIIMLVFNIKEIILLKFLLILVNMMVFIKLMSFLFRMNLRNFIINYYYLKIKII